MCIRDSHTDMALVDLEEAISLDSSQPEIYLMRGEIYLAQKKKDLAKRDFEKAISLSCLLYTSRIYYGFGANTDIIAASVEAYIDCINKF